MDLTRRDFLAAGAAALSLPALAQDPAGLVMHEWGIVTVAYRSKWTSVRTAGSRRVAGAELAAAGLPSYVASWEQSVKAQIKEWEETPVIITKPIVYFYAPKATAIWMRVSVPTGRPHVWWPPADDFGPKADLPARNGFNMDDPKAPPLSEIKPEHGFLLWKELTVDPAAVELPKAEGWWAAARRTDAAAVRHAQGAEKFVYYDALAIYEPAVDIDWKKDGTVELTNRTSRAFPHVIAVRVREGKCSFAHARDWGKGRTLTLTPAAGVPALADALVAAGLYRQEADALVDIWREEFFAMDGVRVLAIASREEYDAVLPIEIRPTPKELARVLIAHIECLDETGRQRIADFIAKLAGDDIAERDGAAAALRKLRPLADEMIRKAADAASDAEVRARLTDLLER
jgi:hypothetical protein